jgi:hypothetical protein
LRVKREGIKQHGADEGDVGGLAVVDPLPSVYPQSGQFRENINCLEGFQVVDEDVWNPQTFYKLKIHYSTKNNYPFCLVLVSEKIPTGLKFMKF